MHKNIIYMENSEERGNLIPLGLLDEEDDSGCAILYDYHFETEGSSFYLVLHFEHSDFCFNKYYVLNESDDELFSILFNAKALRLMDGKVCIDMLLQYIFSFRYKKVDGLGYYIYGINIQEDSYKGNFSALHNKGDIFKSIIKDNFGLIPKKGGN